jgi:hypothetical protein
MYVFAIAVAPSSLYDLPTLISDPLCKEACAEASHRSSDMSVSHLPCIISPHPLTSRWDAIAWFCRQESYGLGNPTSRVMGMEVYRQVQSFVETAPACTLQVLPTV